MISRELFLNEGKTSGGGIGKVLEEEVKGWIRRGIGRLEMWEVGNFQ